MSTDKRDLLGPGGVYQRTVQGGQWNRFPLRQFQINGVVNREPVSSSQAQHEAIIWITVNLNRQFIYIFEKPGGLCL